MATNYAKHASIRQTPINEPIPGKQQVANSTGGYAFPVDCWIRLQRFLILGNEGGSYYASERKLTQKNANAVRECYSQDPKRTIDTIVEISESGRAPKNDPAIFALAMLSTDKYALEVMPRVCRIGTHLFQFVEAARYFRGRGRAFNTSLKKWYLDKSPRDLSYQVTKYQQRDGWSHRDILRLCKPVPTSQNHNLIFSWITGAFKESEAFSDSAEVIDIDPILAFEKAKTVTKKSEIVKLITDHDLVRECVPTQWLNEPEVWEALLQKMPMTAMIRNLGKMSAVGLLKPMSKTSQLVAERLVDSDRLKKARIHPLSLLVAQVVYSRGKGIKGSLSWNPDSGIVQSLDDAFYLSFDSVEPTNKRHLLALDVSGSMGFCEVAGMPITPRVASGAMAMTAVRTERLVHTLAFSHQLIGLTLTRQQSLRDVVNSISNTPFGATNISLPMQYARDNKIEVDAFVVYTDSEANRGDEHACQALDSYRQKMGIGAKLIVVGMVSNGFTVADPNDAGMMDVVGFDTNAPVIMSDFIR